MYHVFHIQSLKGVLSTQHDTMSEVGRLKEDYRTRDAHKQMLTYENFFKIPFERETGRPERGYGSVLPRHPDDYRKMHLITSHSVDYQYRFEWTPKSPTLPVCMQYYKD